MSFWSRENSSGSGWCTHVASSLSDRALNIFVDELCLQTIYGSVPDPVQWCSDTFTVLHSKIYKSLQYYFLRLTKHPNLFWNWGCTNTVAVLNTGRAENIFFYDYDFGRSKNLKMSKSGRRVTDSLFFSAGLVITTPQGTLVPTASTQSFVAGHHNATTMIVSAMHPSNTGNTQLQDTISVFMKTHVLDGGVIRASFIFNVWVAMLTFFSIIL